MKTLKVYELLKKRVLVTRASARILHQELAATLVEGHGELTLDFSGVDGLTPSFLDEVLTVIEECITSVGHTQLLVKVLNAPTQLSSKFSAVVRGHGLTIVESGPGIWLIYHSGKPSLHNFRKV